MTTIYIARIDSVYEIQISNSHVSDTGISEFRGRIGEEFKGNDNAGSNISKLQRGLEPPEKLLDK